MALPGNIRDREYLKFDTNAQAETIVRTETSLKDSEGHLIGPQHPIPVNLDSIYADDIDLTESDNGGFSGAVTDYFDSLTTVNFDASANNPKTITLWFKRTVYASELAFGCNDLTKTFSNIKANFLGSGKVIRSIIDESADNTKYNSKVIEFAPSAFNGIILEFHTADEVGLSNINIRKETKTSAAIEAQKPDGTIVNLTATKDGNLKVANVEDGLSIAKGDVEGTTFIHKFGSTPDFDNADGSVTIWDGANDADIDQMRYVYSTTAIIDSVSSSSILDVELVQIQGLDGDYNLITQTAILTGQTRVVLTTPLLRIFRIKNAGTIDNAGHIYVYENTLLADGVPVDSTKVRAVIQPLNNQTLMAVYTVPLGKTAYLRDWYSSTSGANKSSNYVIELRARPEGGVFQLKHVARIQVGRTSYIKHEYIEPEVFVEKVDIEMRASMLVNTTGASISAGFDIVLIDN